MQKIKRGIIRFLAVAAVVAIMQPLLPTLSLADNSRDFANCIQGCNDGYNTCGDRCLDDCADLYTPGSAQYNACVNSCKDLCNVVKLACKDRCQAIKNGGCPPEP